MEKALKEAGIPVLGIETDYVDSDAQQLRTRTSCIYEKCGGIAHVRKQHYILFPNHDNGMRLHRELKALGIRRSSPRLREVQASAAGFP